VKQFLNLLLVCLPIGAHAQCTKDVDCKGDRICEKGMCIAPATSLIPAQKAAPLPVSLAAAPLGTTDVFGAALQDQLACAERPEPGKALRALRGKGVIAAKPVASIDGMNVFPVLQPISVFGFRVLQVTGWEESGDRSLFWRGPGTAPPLHIAAVVVGEPSSVKRAVEKLTGKRASVTKATYTQYASAATEITCYAN
jgi:hypothetical protein